MKKTFLLSAFAAVLFASCGDGKHNDSVDNADDQNKEMAKDAGIKKDADFAVEAASGGMMEVELGNMAMAQGASQAVKDFGQGMVNDHSMANDELKALAASKQLTLPTVPGEKHQNKIDRLKDKKGADFDKEYMSMMVDDHKEDIDLFQKEADKGEDAEIKSWAAGKVGTLQHHLQMAQEIKDKLK